MEAITYIEEEVDSAERTKDFVVGNKGLMRYKPKRHSGMGYSSPKDGIDKPTEGGSHYKYTSRDKLRELREPPIEEDELNINKNSDEDVDTPVFYESPDPEQWKIMQELKKENDDSTKEHLPAISEKEAKEIKDEAMKEKYFGVDR